MNRQFAAGFVANHTSIPLDAVDIVSVEQWDHKTRQWVSINLDDD